ncbi:hypothetical protein [Rhodoblastus sp.]|uniref:hypothetical protein n=1 Tax=Rhodoblastus sp. TaxID=1962975 RepID=UPI0035AF6FFD
MAYPLSFMRQNGQNRLASVIEIIEHIVMAYPQDTMSVGANKAFPPGVPSPRLRGKGESLA